MAHDLAYAVEKAKVDFLYADIFKFIKEELSLRLYRLTYVARPPRSAHLKILRTYDTKVYVQKRFCAKAEVALSVGLALKAFFFANAIARTINTLIPLDLDLDKYPSSIRAEIHDGQERMLKMFRFGMFDPLLPPQRWRQVLTYTLTYKTLEWIMAHEAEHIMRGHIEMPRKLRQAPWIAQLTESQADDFATLRLLLTLRTEVHNYEEKPWREDWAHFAFCSRSDRINTNLIAMLLSFALVGNKSDETFLQTPPSSELPWRPYPPTAYRLWRAIKLLTTPLRTNPLMPPLKPLDPQTDGMVSPSDLYSFVGVALSRVIVGRHEPLTRLTPMHHSVIEEYDRILMDNLAPLAAYENDWRARNLDPNRATAEIARTYREIAFHLGCGERHEHDTIPPSQSSG
jgi:hypothetical protein